MRELLTALVIGLIGGAIPGPVLTAVFTEIIRKGLVQSFRIVFQALLTESAVAVICLVLLSILPIPAEVFAVLSIIGSFVLIYIATKLWRIQKFTTNTSEIFTYWTISVLILANGMLWTYWITVVLPKALEFSTNVIGGSWYYLGSVQLGWLISTLLIAFVFSRFRGFLTKPTVIPYLFKFFAVVFVFFALRMFYTSIMVLIQP